MRRITGLQRSTAGAFRPWRRLRAGRWQAGFADSTLPRTRRMGCYRKILVPIDGSEISARGVEEALRLARDQQAEVRFIYVVDESVIRYDYSGMADIGELIEIQRKSGRQATEKAQQRATELGVK